MSPLSRELNNEERVAYARDLKDARSQTLKDAENFDELLYSFERLGSYLSRSSKSLKVYKDDLQKIAGESVLSNELPQRFPTSSLSFDVLYELVRDWRNDALHQGAVARNLARHAQELSIIVEDGLMSRAHTVAEFMVRNPICAQPWESIGAIRRILLLNAFSFLPFFNSASQKWSVISDSCIARFLRSTDKATRDARILMTVPDALREGLDVISPIGCRFDEPVIELAKRIGTEPFLVMDEHNQLCGIVTAFDLL